MYLEPCRAGQAGASILAERGVLCSAREPVGTGTTNVAAGEKFCRHAALARCWQAVPAILFLERWSVRIRAVATYDDPGWNITRN